MKKTSKSREKSSEDMQAEYQFDYITAKPNRFAGRIAKDRLVVLLDPEVSKVFTDSESVNAALRRLVSAPKNLSEKFANNPESNQLTQVFISCVKFLS